MRPIDARALAAPVPVESPILIASLLGSGQVGPDGLVTLVATATAGPGQALAALEASSSGADGQ